MLLEYVKLFRVHQYIKNLFIFAPMFFAFDFTIDNLIKSVIAFTLFSLLASSVYIFNDLMDVNEDRQHPTKRFRPLASGQISERTAKTVMYVLAFCSLSASLLLSVRVFLTLLMYLILNISYSVKLKHIPIIDIFIIAIGFVLRLFVGAYAIEKELSMWIIIMTFLLALFLALAKRRDDVLLSLQGKQTRKNIYGYNFEFINASMVLMAGVIIVSYILYTVSPAVIAKMKTDKLYLTSLFVILGILRYMQITFVEQNSGSPTKIVLRDRFLQLTILFWLLSFVVIVKLT